MAKSRSINPFEARAEQLGESAFRTGIKAAPALDQRLCDLLAEANPTGSIGSPTSMAIMTAWSRAWHRANVAEPVANPSTGGN